VGRPLRVLIVEDVEPDALLVVRELKRGGFDVTHERVDTPEGMMAALATHTFDVIISDYALPRFSAPLALELVKQRAIDIPFIIVSGTVGEETAVEAIRAGAHDYMAKGRFARLIPAVERELRDAALRLERARMQEQLLISDRMASVGTLAAGVAHEINNPLAALMANVELAASDVAKLRAAGAGAGDGVGDRLRTIEEQLHTATDAAGRVRQIVADLKIFSRADQETVGPVDVRGVLESSIRIAWNEIRHRARLVRDYGAVPAAIANEGRLGQVFLNLLVNAAQAITEGAADENEIRVATSVDASGRIVVEVHDTGSGIPPGVITRIFDPFFTTKAIGVGTGLGLTICHRIVTSFGGQIHVESPPGAPARLDGAPARGTSFRVTLPAAPPPPAPPAPPAAPPPSPPATAGDGAGRDGGGKRRGKILVIDDEPTVGGALKRMLQIEHDVQALTTAREALELVARGERYDIIFCDLMMPEMTGMDLFAELTQKAPDQAAKMVFMTGGAFTPRAREFLDKATNPHVEKPFDLAGLRALVRTLLGG